MIAMTVGNFIFFGGLRNELGKDRQSWYLRMQTSNKYPMLRLKAQRVTLMTNGMVPPLVRRSNCWTHQTTFVGLAWDFGPAFTQVVPGHPRHSRTNANCCSVFPHKTDTSVVPLNNVIPSPNSHFFLLPKVELNISRSAMTSREKYIFFLFLWGASSWLVQSAALGRARRENPNQRNILFVNKSGRRVDVLWINRATDPVTYRTNSENGEGYPYGASQGINSYLSHEFQVREMPSKKSGKCLSDECRTAYFQVNDQEGQSAYVRLFPTRSCRVLFLNALALYGVTTNCNRCRCSFLFLWFCAFCRGYLIERFYHQARRC